MREAPVERRERQCAESPFARLLQIDAHVGKALQVVRIACAVDDRDDGTDAHAAPIPKGNGVDGNAVVGKEQFAQRHLSVLQSQNMGTGTVVVGMLQYGADEGVILDISRVSVEQFEDCAHARLVVVRDRQQKRSAPARILGRQVGAIVVLLDQKLGDFFAVVGDGGMEQCALEFSDARIDVCIMRNQAFGRLHVIDHNEVTDRLGQIGLQLLQHYFLEVGERVTPGAVM